MRKNEKLVCDLCGKTFDTPGRLWSYKLVYHGNKDYSCEKWKDHFKKNLIVARKKVLHDEGFINFVNK